MHWEDLGAGPYLPDGTSLGATSTDEGYVIEEDIELHWEDLGAGPYVPEQQPPREVFRGRFDFPWFSLVFHTNLLWAHAHGAPSCVACTS